MSAVDNHVGATLTSECIMGMLKDSCVVLATHRYSATLLNAADHIILMENGRISASGTHRDLLAQGITILDAEEAEESEPESAPAEQAGDTEVQERSEKKETKTDEEKKASSKLTEKEGVEEGKVSKKVYATYMKVGFRF